MLDAPLRRGFRLLLISAANNAELRKEGPKETPTLRDLLKIA